MTVAGIEFPGRCPDKCPGHDDEVGQGGMCHRCPVFNCEEVVDTDGKPFRLLEPNEYRKDWAEAWKRWFDGDLRGRPVLHS